MYRGFNVSEFRFKSMAEEYEKIGQSIFDADRAAIEGKIDSFKNPKGHLEASKISAKWFPEVKADIFLSHSHQDERLVIQLAGWLKSEFGLTSFIDSTVWGYSEKLLKIIDDQYCQDKETGIYSYQNRNQTTSHVYMMLTIALAKMLDSCECVFFINTPKSITLDDNIGDSGFTMSPWIYSEIAMTGLIRKRTKDEHRGRTLLKAANESYAFDSVDVAYDVDLSHLAPLNADDLNRWRQSTKAKSVQALDKLYELK